MFELLQHFSWYFLYLALFPLPFKSENSWIPVPPHVVVPPPVEPAVVVVPIDVDGRD